MKKLGLLLMLFILPLTVSAATINVKSLDATAETKTIKYSGEMEDGSVAVMCKLYLGDDEIDYLSSEVVSNKFEGTFTVSDAGTYTVYCANYEGGDIKSVDVEVVNESKDVATPATLDNVATYTIIGIISLLSLIVIGKYLKKQVR